MSYHSTTIASIITKLNAEYFLPAIQRPYIWKPDQLVRLFDSIMNGYPISSFLFWDLKEENKRNWDIYKFIENFSYGDTHNEIALTDGLNVNLVLDGQQRLTSLFIGLKGTYRVKKKYKRSASPDAWIKKQLYINLLKDPKIDDDEASTEVSYGFLMLEVQPKNTETEYWFRVGKILKFDDRDEFDDFKEDLIDNLPEATTERDNRVFSNNIDRLRKVIWEDEVISYYTEKSQVYDRVLDIFIRANDGGTKLSKSDLLLSMMTSKWGDRNAREEIYDFVDFLNNKLPRDNNIDKEVVMKACLLLTDLPHTYKVANFTKVNLEKIQENWPNIKDSLKKTLTLVNRFGIDRETLLSANALLPIAYFLSKKNHLSFDSTEQKTQKIALSIRQWVLITLLNSTFGSTTDRVIGLARDTIREKISASDEFPLYELSLELRKHGNFTNPDDFIEDILETVYKDKTCFLVLSLIHEGRYFGDSDYHIDHIFPRSMFATGKLLSSGISEGNVETYQEYSNRLGNLQILSSSDNTKKSAKKFSEWVEGNCDDAYIEEYCIPKNRELYKLDKFIEFVSQREQLMGEKLRDNIITANAFS